MSEHRQHCHPTDQLTVSHTNDTVSESVPLRLVSDAYASNRPASQRRTTDYVPTQLDHPTGLIVTINNSPLPTRSACDDTTVITSNDEGSPWDTNLSV